jgi:hypothetical protein
VLVGVGLIVVAVGLFGQRSEVLAQRVAAYPNAAAGAGGELIALPMPLGDRGQLLTVIDPRVQTIGVYYIDAATGKITLRSVRNIHWDLQISDFNAEAPLPREIRSQLEHNAPP